ncbi:MAG TPA: type II secretion system F family protein [Acidimicrobiia bacterium]|nr:type II secretion system F family protein [Acidimicrobiia bacterium]
MVALAASGATALAAGLLVYVLVNRERTPRSRRRDRLPGLDVSPPQFWATVIGVAALTYFVVFALTGLVVVSLVPALVVATLPKAYFVRKRAQRLARVQEAWPDGLRDLLSSVRSGASLPSAIENLASFGPEPLREAFQGFDVYSRSLGVVRALEMIKDDIADPTADRIIEVLILAYERGGNVVPAILSDLAEATTKDLWTLEQVRTEVLEQKINSRVVFVLPWIVLIAITARSGAFRQFYSSTAGLIVVAIGGAMSLVGVAVASRLGAQPTEPRVFAGSRS